MSHGRWKTEGWVSCNKCGNTHAPGKCESFTIDDNYSEPSGEVLVCEQEINSLRKLRDLVKAALKQADREHLYLGLGHDVNFSRPQEGPNVKLMREIVLPGTEAK